MRVCTKCGVEKETTEFYQYKRKSGRIDSRPECKTCTKKSTGAYAKAYRKQRGTIDARLRNTFGITLDEYEQRFAEQGGECAICGAEPTDKKLAVDHDHKTGKVRGLLCSNCNSGLGLLRDDPAILLRGYHYIRKGR